LFIPDNSLGRKLIISIAGASLLAKNFASKLAPAKILARMDFLVYIFSPHAFNYRKVSS